MLLHFIQLQFVLDSEFNVIRVRMIHRIYEWYKGVDSGCLEKSSIVGEEKRIWCECVDREFIRSMVRRADGKCEGGGFRHSGIR